MYDVLFWLLFLGGIVPWFRAWQVNAGSSLRHALAWAWAAWGVWGLALLAEGGIYVALSLTAAAGVAVLGARRPGVSAWNFVVAGLLAVLLLPLAENAILDTSPRLGGPRLLFLAATLLVTLLNYLPTRQAPTALALGMVSAVELAVLAGAETWTPGQPVVRVLLATLPWLAWAAVRSAPPASSQFDETWLHFRDRFGLVWSQRVREQFNNAAHHAGWPVVLRWSGLRIRPGSPPLDETTKDGILTTLHAILKRFEPSVSEQAF